MAAPVIAVTDSVFPSLDPAKAALARLNPTYRMSKGVSADDILAVARDADAILVTYAKLTRDILVQLTRCKAIGRFGLGVDNIDLATAKEKGIAVNYVPDYCIREVSDHAMALLLALIRKIPLSNKLVQSGRWEMPAVVPAGSICGQVGFPGIGKGTFLRRQNPVARISVPESKSADLCLGRSQPLARVIRNRRHLGNSISLGRQRAESHPVAPRFMPGAG